MSRVEIGGRQRIKKKKTNRSHASIREADKIWLGTPAQIGRATYILIDGGKTTTVSYISNTTPIPHDKPELAAATALAAALLGMQVVYLDAGSGADRPVPADTIAAVRKSVSLPIFVGGGIRSASAASAAWKAGADWLVVGTAGEQSHQLVEAIAQEKPL